MKISISLVFSILLLLSFSCKTTSTLQSEKRKGLPEINSYSQSWDSTLLAGKTQVKLYWINRMSDVFAKTIGLDLNSDEIDKLTMLPSPVYVIDSININKIKSDDDFNKYLRIDKTRATYYVLKEDKIIAVIYSKFVNNKWVNSEGYGNIFKIVSEKLTYLYFKKHTQFYSVKVNYFPSYNHNYADAYLVYIEDGKLISNWAGEEMDFFEQISMDKKSYAFPE